MDDDQWQECTFIARTITRVPWKNEDGEEENEEEAEEDSDSDS